MVRTKEHIDTEKEQEMERANKTHDCATYGCRDSRFKSRVVRPTDERNSWHYQIALNRANVARADLLRLMQAVKSA